MLAPYCPVLSEDSILLASALSSRRKSEAWTSNLPLQWLDDRLFAARVDFKLETILVCAILPPF